MDNFQIIVLLVAVVALILCLVAVGISLQNKGKTDPFPKLQAPCPDGWGIDTSGCRVNTTVNFGTGNISSVNNAFTGTAGVWMNNTNTNLVGNINATICDKRKWAIGNSINWDGISNYNQCV